MKNLKVILSDPRLYVSEWLTLNNISVNERGEVYCPSKPYINNFDVLGTIWLDYVAQFQNYNALEKTKAPNLRELAIKFSERELTFAFDEKLKESKIKAKTETIEKLRCKGENLEPVKAFVRALKGEDSILDTMVMAHWVWMVKRKMQNLEARYHIMPVLYSAQGAGKTFSLNKLVSPINNYRLNIKMDQMADSRYAVGMAENYVIVFDELQGASRTDVDILKNQITADYNDARKLGTHIVSKVRQSCSFLGSTNRPIKEQIVDYTGMRRFWQVDCQPKINWDLINSINYLELWQGIDESKENGYIYDYLDQISDVQKEELTLKDEVQLFLEEMGVAFHNPEENKGTFKSSRELYAMYREWRGSHGLSHQDSMKFFTKLPRFNGGVRSVVKKVNGKTQRGFYVSTEKTFEDLVEESDTLSLKLRMFR
jgi:hypothetical protein